MKRLLLVLLLATTSIRAQDSPEATFNMQNGRFWNRMAGTSADQFRSIFLVGLMDGWTLRGMTKDVVLAKELTAWKPGPKSSLTDLAATITSIYSEPENEPLPIGWVVMGTFAVQRGDASRDAMLTALRKHLTEMMDGGSHSLTDVDPIDVIMALKKQ